MFHSIKNSITSPSPFFTRRIYGVYTAMKRNEKCFDRQAITRPTIVVIFGTGDQGIRISSLKCRQNIKLFEQSRKTNIKINDKNIA